MIFDRKYDKNREMELVRKEVELYKQEEMLRVDELVAENRSSAWKKVENTALECAKQTAEYEHTFHFNQELKGIEIARLETTISLLQKTLGDMKDYDFLKRSVAQANARYEGCIAVISNLKEQIKNYDNTLKIIVNRYPLIELDHMGVSVLNTSEKK